MLAMCQKCVASVKINKVEKCKIKVEKYTFWVLKFRRRYGSI